MGSFLPFLVIIAVIVSVVSKAAKNDKAKKQREAQQARTVQQAEQQTADNAAQPAQQRAVYTPAPEYRGSMDYSSAEGKTYTQGGSLGGKPTVTAANTTLKSGAKHVVRATSEGGHTHTESTASAQKENCRDESVQLQADHAYDIGVDGAGFELDFDHDSVKKALIYSEIFGEPRSRRPRRMAR